MTSMNSSQQKWEKYCKEELALISPLLKELGFSIDKEQVHISGERFLMTGSRDVGGGGRKLVLLGHRLDDNRRVVIKASSDEEGKNEIEREHNVREIIKRIDFAYRTFFMPEEILFYKKNNVIISITDYIEQDRAFLSRSIQEQFFLALRAFETQEDVHATTRSHAEAIKSVLNIVDAKYYLNSFTSFREIVAQNDIGNTEIIKLMDKAKDFLEQNRTIIDRYSGFLTHSDFVPNNLRVSGNDMYLLDYASIHFGNKYESWARFLNFMTHHNRTLELALTDYVKSNRDEDEYFSLRLMRVYKIGFLLQFYANSLKKTSGNLEKLTLLRLAYWKNVMDSLLEDKPIPEKDIKIFMDEENLLRTENEKKRQAELLGDKRLV